MEHTSYVDETGSQRKMDRSNSNIFSRHLPGDENIQHTVAVNHADGERRCLAGKETIRKVLQLGGESCILNEKNRSTKNIVRMHLGVEEAMKHLPQSGER